MYRRYWVLIFAVVGWLTTTPAVAVPPPDANPHNTREVGGNEGESKNSQPEREYRFSIPFGVCASFPSAIDGLSKPDNPSDESYYKPEDLKAQQATACFTEWIFYGTALQFALSCLGAILLFRTIALSREANKVARVVGKNQTRAYVYVEKFEYRKDDFPLVAFVKNGGQTPARTFEVLMFAGVDSKVSKPDDVVPLVLGPLGPGDTIPIPISQEGLSEVMEKHNTVCRMGGSSILGVVGTVTYETIYGEEFQTDLLFHTHKRVEGNIPVRFDISNQSNPQPFRLRRIKKAESHIDG